MDKLNGLPAEPADDNASNPTPIYSTDPYGKKIVSFDNGATWAYALKEVTITPRQEDPDK